MPNHSMQQYQNYLSGIIDRFEGEKAVIRLENGAELLWPKERMLKDAGEGGSVRICLFTSQTDTEEREKLAKTILNEILKIKE